MKVILINGFLGSGKTSLLLSLIKILSMHKVACVVNEFGEVSIDGPQVESYDVIKHEINKGSIFCSCKAHEFISVMNDLLQLDLEYILVETSGFSNPSSLQTLLSHMNNFDVMKNLSIVTVVDSVLFPKLVTVLPMLRKQIEVSTTIVINKIDLINEEQLGLLRDMIQKINEKSIVVETQFSEFPLNALAFGTNQSLPNIGTQTKRIDFKSITVQCREDMTSKDLQNAFLKLSHIYRAKGFVCLQDGTFKFDYASQSVSFTEAQFGNNQIVILYSSMQTSKVAIIETLESILVF